MEIIEGALKFEFPATYQAAKYDDWAHYRNQFQNKCSQYNKAVDILAFEENQNCCWLCEVKDFRINGRNPDKLPLEQEIAQKVRDTLEESFLPNSVPTILTKKILLPHY